MLADKEFAQFSQVRSLFCWLFNQLLWVAGQTCLRGAQLTLLEMLF